MTMQNWAYSNSFLAIDHINVNFNNASGLLASSSTADLYNLSRRNGSAQKFSEFRGYVQVNDTSDPPTGNVRKVPTVGSLLVINPVYDLNLPAFLSSSSLGQFQFQFQLSVTNYFPYSVTPKLVVVAVNSGVFSTVAGTSMIQAGLLTKESVLEAKSHGQSVPKIDSSQYERLIRGQLCNRGMSNVRHLIKEFKPSHKENMGGVLSAGHRSKLSKLVS
jgi:hypothetical protein